VLEEFALPSVPVRAGFARSGHRTSLLSWIQLTEGSGAGPGDGWRGGPGPDPSVAVAAADFARCVGDLRDDAPLGDDRDDPHGRAARAEQRVDLVDAADQLGPALPEQLALGRIGLGANRRTDGDRRVYAANIAPGFRCDVSVMGQFESESVTATDDTAPTGC
jgi:hypothetical protein